MTSLEGTIEIPKVLENTIETAEGDKKFVYRGEIFNLKFTGLSLYGNSRLEKSETKTRYETKRTRISWFPPKVVESENPVHNNKTIWSIIAGYSEKSDTNSILSWGEIKNKRGYGGYRSSLIGNAANQGILLSDELLDKVFGPLEAQLLEIYNKVKDFGAKGVEK